MSMNDAPEAQIVTRLREAEQTIAELRATVAALRGEEEGSGPTGKGGCSALRCLVEPRTQGTGGECRCSARKLRRALHEARAELAAEREAFRALSAERDQWIDRSGREAAELAAVGAALRGEPVPNASELVRAVAGWRAGFYREEGRAAGLSYERSIARAEVRRLGGDPNALPRAGWPWALSPGDYAEEGDRLAAEQAARCARRPPCPGGSEQHNLYLLGGARCPHCGIARQDAAEPAPAPEDDGLTDADRAAGWRWETAYGVWHLYTPIGALAAVVDDEGWVARVRGPETGAAGQRAAVRALRKAGVMGGGR